MFTQTIQTRVFDKARTQSQGIVVVALLAGLLLGKLFTLILPGLPTLAAIAMWPLGTAVALISVAIMSFRLLDEPRWGMAIAGQLLGIMGIALLFFVSVA